MTQPQDIARELVDAIDQFGITDNPPRLPCLMQRHLVDAINQLEGPNIDAEARLTELLQVMLDTANMLRNIR